MWQGAILWGCSFGLYLIRSYGLNSKIHAVKAKVSRGSTSLNARPTLADYLVQEKVLPEIAVVLQSFATVSILIARQLASAAITGSIGSVDVDSTNPSGEQQKKLDVIANELVKDSLWRSQAVFAMASEEDEDIAYYGDELPASGGLLVAFDPLDGSSNIDCASPTGTIFGAYRILERTNILRSAKEGMVAAGYVLYSSSVEYVFSFGRGTCGFTLDPESEQFVLTRSSIRVPDSGPFYSLNEGRSADWPPGLLRYVEDVKNGRGRRQGVRYGSRYVCSLVADVHRTLLYGGWAGNPRSHLRLLYEAAPLAFLAEQAGGAGTDGVTDLTAVTPTKTHHRLPVFIGSRDDIEELKSYGDVQQVRTGKY